MNRKKSRPKSLGPSKVNPYAVAVGHYQAGRLGEARDLLLRGLAARPNDVASLNLLAIISARTQRLNEAERYFRLLTTLQPGDPNPHNNLGNLFLAGQRFQEAENAYRAALQLAPEYPEAAYNLARLYRHTGRAPEAEEAYRQAIRSRPSFDAAYAGLGGVLRNMDRSTEAESAFREALRLRPDSAEALNGLAVLLQEAGRDQEAEKLFRQAIGINPLVPETLNNLGLLLRKKHRLHEAEASFRDALRLQPNVWEVHQNLGLTLRDAERMAEAENAFREVVRLHPDGPDGYNNLALALKQSGRWLEARDCLTQLLRIDPDYRYATGLGAEIDASICDWSRQAESAEALSAGVGQGKSCVEPFTFIKVSDDPALQRRCAERFVADRCSVRPVLDPAIPRYSHQKIRLAYLSADFRDHPVAHLVEALLAEHDREQFELTAVAFGPARSDPMTARLLNYFDHVLDVRAESDEAAARTLRAMQIDVAIDLSGLTAHARTGILAQRPAPIQVNYLGFPATMGAPFIDYLLADRIVVPEAAKPCYSEKVVYLPDTFLTVSHWNIASTAPSRDELNLPADAFVFCCFNNCNKIQPVFFDIWMRLLHQIERSVLWLTTDNPLAQSNLRGQAEARGVAADRLVFAPRVPLAEHLARHRRADLFLDTLPHNAITTAAMALWSGLPVLTCLGNSFAGRACASLLSAIGAPELITDDVGAYEALALRLATEPCQLTRIRNAIEQNRLTHPLFDTRRFTRNIEAAYRRMWEIRQRGDGPREFTLPAAQAIPASLKPL